jgi:hypothetical protein
VSSKPPSILLDFRGAYRIRTCDFHRVRSRKQQRGATDRNGQEPAQRRRMVI